MKIKKEREISFGWFGPIIASLRAASPDSSASCTSSFKVSSVIRFFE